MRSTYRTIGLMLGQILSIVSIIYNFFNTSRLNFRNSIEDIMINNLKTRILSILFSFN